MSTDSWIRQSLGVERVQQALEEARRQRSPSAPGRRGSGCISAAQLRFIADSLELQVFDLLDGDDGSALRSAAAEAFHVACAVPRPAMPVQAAEQLIRLCCLSLLGGQEADVLHLLNENKLPTLPVDDPDWGIRVWATTLHIWLCLFSKRGGMGLEAIESHVAALRRDQRQHEPSFLARAEERRDTRPAWELITLYHVVKAAEVLALYIGKGAGDGHLDVQEQLKAQFGRAITAAERAQMMERESLVRLLSQAAPVLGKQQWW
jgi:hypothetical protein